MSFLCAVCQQSTSTLRCDECQLDLCTEAHCDAELHAGAALRRHVRRPIVGAIGSRQEAAAETTTGDDEATAAAQPPAAAASTGGSLSTVCDICEEHPNAWACQECGQEFCHVCDADMHRPAAMAGHRRQTIGHKKGEAASTNETPSAPPGVVTAAAPLCDMCEEHPAAVHCVSCKLALCAVGGCDVEMHRITKNAAHVRTKIGEAATPVGATVLPPTPAVAPVLVSPVAAAPAVAASSPTTPAAGAAPIPCEVCDEQDAAVHCADCRMDVCIAGGCDGDLHKPGSKNAGHHRTKLGGAPVATPPIAVQPTLPTPIADVASSPLSKKAADCEVCEAKPGVLACDECMMDGICLDCDLALHKSAKSSTHKRTRLDGAPFTPPAAVPTPAASPAPSPASAAPQSTPALPPALPSTSGASLEPCGVCDDADSTLSCLECALDLCATCSQDLHKPMRMAGHTITPFGQPTPMMAAAPAPSPMRAPTPSSTSRPITAAPSTVKSSPTSATRTLAATPSVPAPAAALCGACDEHPPEVRCTECRMDLCCAGGCDTDLHQTGKAATHQRTRLSAASTALTATTPSPVLESKTASPPLAAAAPAASSPISSAVEAPPVCEVCDELPSEVRCAECAMDLCRAGGCDRDLHKIGRKNAAHHRTAHGAAAAAASSVLLLHRTTSEPSAQLLSSSSTPPSRPSPPPACASGPLLPTPAPAAASLPPPVAVAPTSAAVADRPAELCGVCDEHLGEVRCVECRMDICLRGGCDGDLHASGKSAKHVRVQIGAPTTTGQAVKTPSANAAPAAAAATPAAVTPHQEPAALSAASKQPSATAVGASPPSSPTPELSAKEVVALLVSMPVGQLCDLCDEATPVVRCVECAQFFCSENECDQQIHKAEKLKGHQRVSVQPPASVAVRDVIIQPMPKAAAAKNSRVDPKMFHIIPPNFVGPTSEPAQTVASRATSSPTSSPTSIAAKSAPSPPAISSSPVTSAKPLPSPSPSDIVPSAMNGAGDRRECELCEVDFAELYCAACKLYLDASCSADLHKPERMHGHAIQSIRAEVPTASSPPASSPTARSVAAPLSISLSSNPQSPESYSSRSLTLSLDTPLGTSRVIVAGAKTSAFDAPVVEEEETTPIVVEAEASERHGEVALTSKQPIQNETPSGAAAAQEQPPAPTATATATTTTADALKQHVSKRDSLQKQSSPKASPKQQQPPKRALQSSPKAATMKVESRNKSSERPPSDAPATLAERRAAEEAKAKSDHEASQLRELVQQLQARLLQVEAEVAATAAVVVKTPRHEESPRRKRESPRKKKHGGHERHGHGSPRRGAGASAPARKPSPPTSPMDSLGRYRTDDAPLSPTQRRLAELEVLIAHQLDEEEDTAAAAAATHQEITEESESEQPRTARRDAATPRRSPKERETSPRRQRKEEESARPKKTEEAPNKKSSGPTEVSQSSPRKKTYREEELDRAAAAKQEKDSAAFAAAKKALARVKERERKAQESEQKRRKHSTTRKKVHRAAPGRGKDAEEEKQQSYRDERDVSSRLRHPHPSPPPRRDDLVRFEDADEPSLVAELLPSHTRPYRETFEDDRDQSRRRPSPRRGRTSAQMDEEDAAYEAEAYRRMHSGGDEFDHRAEPPRHTRASGGRSARTRDRLLAASKLSDEATNATLDLVEPPQRGRHARSPRKSPRLSTSNAPSWTAAELDHHDAGLSAAELMSRLRREAHQEVDERREQFLADLWRSGHEGLGLHVGAFPPARGARMDEEESEISEDSTDRSSSGAPRFHPRPPPPPFAFADTSDTSAASSRAASPGRHHAGGGGAGLTSPRGAQTYSFLPFGAHGVIGGDKVFGETAPMPSRPARPATAGARSGSRHTRQATHAAAAVDRAFHPMQPSYPPGASASAGRRRVDQPTAASRARSANESTPASRSSVQSSAVYSTFHRPIVPEYTPSDRLVDQLEHGPPGAWRQSNLRRVDDPHGLKRVLEIAKDTMHDKRNPYLR